MGMKSLRV